VKNPHATLEAGVAEADPRPLTLKAVGFEAWSISNTTHNHQKFVPLKEFLQQKYFAKWKEKCHNSNMQSPGVCLLQARESIGIARKEKKTPWLSVS